MATFHLSGPWQQIATVADYPFSALKLQSYGDVQIMVAASMPASSDLGITLTPDFPAVFLAMGSAIFNLYARPGEQSTSAQPAALVVMPVMH